MEAEVKRFLHIWGPVIFWAGVIFALSSYSTLPGPEIIWWDFIFKKSAHMTVYAILFYLMQRATNWGKPQKTYLLPLLLTILYALSDEYHQSFVPGRTSLISDVGYDFIGASLVMLRRKQLI